MSGRFLKCIAAVLVSLFTFTTMCAADPSLAYQVRIDEQHGKVVERFKGDAQSDMCIIHVQDAHDSFEAQTNIAEIICALLPQLEGEAKIPFVGIEGACGEYSLKELHDFPINETKERVAKEYVKNGTFVGAELASIIAEENFKLYGLENNDLFVDNFRAFYQVMQHQQALADALLRIEGCVDTLKKRIYNEKLFAFDARVSSYEKQETTLFDFLPFLYTAIEETGIDLFGYVSLLQCENLFLLHRGVDFSRVDCDLEKLFRQLTSVASVNPKVPACYAQYQNKKLSQYALIQYFRHLADEANIDFSQYVSLQKAQDYWHAYSMINMYDVLRDILHVAFQIRLHLAQTDDEEKLLRSWKTLVCVKQFLSLRALKEDVAAFRNNERAYSVKMLVRNIVRLASKYDVVVQDHARIQDFDRIMNEADAFYRAAEKRDTVMLDNLLKKMNEQKQKVGVLVAGGYHSQGLTALMQKRNIPYVVVRPQMLQQDLSTGYMSRMMGEVAPLAPVLISHFQMSQLQATGQMLFSDFPDVVANALGIAEVRAITDHLGKLQTRSVISHLRRALRKKAETGDKKAQLYETIYAQILKPDDQGKTLIERAYASMGATNDTYARIPQFMRDELASKLATGIDAEKNLQQYLDTWRDLVADVLTPQSNATKNLLDLVAPIDVSDTELCTWQGTSQIIGSPTREGLQGVRMHGVKQGAYQLRWDYLSEKVWDIIRFDEELDTDNRKIVLHFDPESFELLPEQFVLELKNKTGFTKHAAIIKKEEIAEYQWELPVYRGWKLSQLAFVIEKEYASSMPGAIVMSGISFQPSDAVTLLPPIAVDNLKQQEPHERGVSVSYRHDAFAVSLYGDLEIPGMLQGIQHAGVSLTSPHAGADILDLELNAVELRNVHKIRVRLTSDPKSCPKGFYLWVTDISDTKKAAIKIPINADTIVKQDGEKLVVEVALNDDAYVQLPKTTATIQNFGRLSHWISLLFHPGHFGAETSEDYNETFTVREVVFIDKPNQLTTEKQSGVVVPITAGKSKNGKMQQGSTFVNTSRDGDPQRGFFESATALAPSLPLIPQIPVRLAQRAVTLPPGQFVDFTYVDDAVVGYLSNGNALFSIIRDNDRFYLEKTGLRSPVDEETVLSQSLGSVDVTVTINEGKVLVQNVSADASVCVQYVVNEARERDQGFKSVDLVKGALPDLSGKKVRITYGKKGSPLTDSVIGVMQKMYWLEENRYYGERIEVQLLVNGIAIERTIYLDESDFSCAVAVGSDDIPMLQQYKETLTNQEKMGQAKKAAYEIAKLVEDGQLGKGVFDDQVVIKALIDNACNFNPDTVTISGKVKGLRDVEKIFWKILSNVHEWFLDGDEMYPPHGETHTSMVYQLNQALGLPIEKYVLDSQLIVDNVTLARDLKSGNTLVRVRAASLAGYLMAFPQVLDFSFWQKLKPLLDDENAVVREVAARSIERVLIMLEDKMHATEYAWLQKRINSILEVRNELTQKAVNNFAHMLVQKKLAVVHSLEAHDGTWQALFDRYDISEDVDRVIQEIQHQNIDVIPLAENILLQPIPAQLDDRRKGRSYHGAIVLALKLLADAEGADVPYLLAMGLGHPKQEVREVAVQSLTAWAKRQSLDAALDVAEVFKCGLLEIMSLTNIRTAAGFIAVLRDQIDNLSNTMANVDFSTYLRLARLYGNLEKAFPVTLSGFKSARISYKDLRVQEDAMNVLTLLLQSGAIAPDAFNRVMQEEDLHRLRVKRHDEIGVAFPEIKFLSWGKTIDLKTPATALIKQIKEVKKQQYGKARMGGFVEEGKDYAIDAYRCVHGTILSKGLQKREAPHAAKTIAVGLDDVIATFNSQRDAYVINNDIVAQLRALRDMYGLRFVLWSDKERQLVRENFIEEHPSIAELFDLVYTKENTRGIPKKVVQEAYKEMGVSDTHNRGKQAEVYGDVTYSDLYFIGGLGKDITFLGYPALIDYRLRSDVPSENPKSRLVLVAALDEMDREKRVFNLFDMIRATLIADNGTVSMQEVYERLCWAMGISKQINNISCYGMIQILGDALKEYSVTMLGDVKGREIEGKAYCLLLTSLLIKMQTELMQKIVKHDRIEENYRTLKKLDAEFTLRDLPGGEQLAYVLDTMQDLYPDNEEQRGDDDFCRTLAGVIREVIDVIAFTKEIAVPSHEPIYPLQETFGQVGEKVLIVDDALKSKYWLKQISEQYGVTVRFYDTIGTLPDNAMIVGVAKKENGEKFSAIAGLRALDLFTEEENEEGVFADPLEAVVIAHFHLRLLELFAAAQEYGGGEVILPLDKSAIFTHWKKLRGNMAFLKEVARLINAVQINKQVRVAA